jgi:hypothetical protein
MTTAMSKNEAHKLVDKMPEDATWDDLMNEIYVRQIIKKGLADSLAGRTTDVREIRAKYSLFRPRGSRI